MKKIILVFTFLLSSPEVFAQWEQVWSCDNGAIVIDKSIYSPDFTQAVIRNPKIVEYLRSKEIPVNEHGEVILFGQNDQKVWNQNDFHGFQSSASKVSTNRNDWVARYGNEIKISFNLRILPGNSDCGHDIPSSDPYCQGRWTEIANWYFRECK